MKVLHIPPRTVTSYQIPVRRLISAVLKSIFTPNYAAFDSMVGLTNALTMLSLPQPLAMPTTFSHPLNQARRIDWPSLRSEPSSNESPTVFPSEREREHEKGITSTPQKEESR